MEIHGNSTTFNLENVLRQNIIGSDYYKGKCLQLGYADVVDEIYETVDHVEPWMSGNARGASTAFCLLNRLFALKLNAKQVKDLLDHADSPYIRAVGFLYLRYVGDPKTLWSWFGPYVKDQEQFSPSGPGQKAVSMGDFVRDLLLSQYYFETIFPRIPKPVQDNINEELRNRNLPTVAKGNGGAGGADRRGVDDAGNKRPASVKASLSVAFGQRAPNRSGAREEGRGRDPSLHESGRAVPRPSASPEPAPRRDDRREDRRDERERDIRKDERRDEPRREDRRDYRSERDRDYRSAGSDKHERRDDRDRVDRDRGGRGQDYVRSGSGRSRSRSRSRGRNERDGERRGGGRGPADYDFERRPRRSPSPRDRGRDGRDRDDYRNGSRR